MKKAITLAFEKSATRETEIFHPWRYFVAGGETLAKIEDVISDYANVEQAKKDFAQKIGAKEYNGTYGTEFDFNRQDMAELSGTERVDYHLQGGNGNEPWQSKRVTSIPDFIVSDGRTFGQFHPDVSTERGRQIRDEMKALEERGQPSSRFARWLGAEGIEVPRDPQYPGDRTRLSATATKIGNEWLVAVPVSAGTWVTPPGSSPISISEYFGKVEKSNLLQNTPKAPGA